MTGVRRDAVDGGGGRELKERVGFAERLLARETDVHRLARGEL